MPSAVVITSHPRCYFKTIGASQETKLLETRVAIAGNQRKHYIARGYTARVENPKGRRTFVVEDEHPRDFRENFSRIVISKEDAVLTANSKHETRWWRAHTARACTGGWMVRCGCGRRNPGWKEPEKADGGRSSTPS